MKSQNPSSRSAGKAPELPGLVRDKIRKKQGIRMGQVHVDWIKRYILYFDKHHPLDMGASQMGQFLIHLSVSGQVSASK